MISCINAETNQVESIFNPDDERHQKVTLEDNTEEAMWKRYVKEKCGTNNLLVYRSRYLKKLVWKYTKRNTWVVYNNYDADKEEEDEEYYDVILQLMSRAPETFEHGASHSVITTTTTTTTTTIVPSRITTRKNTSDARFQPPSLVPAEQDAQVKQDVQQMPTAQDAQDVQQMPTAQDAQVKQAQQMPAAQQMPIATDENPTEPIAKRLKKPAAAASSTASSTASSSTASSTFDVIDSEAARLKQAVMEAERVAAELKEEKIKNAQLQKERDAESAQKVKEQEKHQNYMKRNRKKNQEYAATAQTAQDEADRLRKELDQKEQMAQAERDLLKTKYEEAQRRLKAVKSGDTATAALQPCEGAYLALIKHAMNAYVAEKQRKMAIQSARYQFKNDDDTWSDITDGRAMQIFDQLLSGTVPADVSYPIGGHIYNAHVAYGAFVGQCDIVQQNTNPQHPTERMIKRIDSDSQTKTALSTQDQDDILFGDSPVVISPTWTKCLMDSYNFDDTEHFCKPSLELAQLAELFSSFSSGLTYFSGTKHACTLYVKPIMIKVWLTLAAERQYTHMRICLHGTKPEGYDGVRNDPFGMNLQFAGTNAQAYGNGSYFGMSDHASNKYSRDAGGKATPGTALMALILTPKSLEGHYYEQKKGCYGTFNLMMSTGKDHLPLPSISGKQRYNSIAVYEDRLILILGKIEPLWSPTSP